jgi:hypothetical protein
MHMSCRFGKTCLALTLESLGSEEDKHQGVGHSVRMNAVTSETQAMQGINTAGAYYMLTQVVCHNCNSAKGLLVESNFQWEHATCFCLARVKRCVTGIDP